jgi:hypothetical protein
VLVHGERLPGRREMPRVLSILRDFLCHFTSAQELAVPASQKKALLNLLMNMSADGVLTHTSWKFVPFDEEEDFWGTSSLICVAEFYCQISESQFHIRWRVSLLLFSEELSNAKGAVVSCPFPLFRSKPPD